MKGTLQFVVDLWTDAVRTLDRILQDGSGERFEDLLHEMGFNARAIGGMQDLPIVSAVPPIIADVELLLDALGDGTQPFHVQALAILDFVLGPQGLLATIEDVQNNPPSAATLDELLRSVDFWADFGRELPEFLLLQAIRRRHSQLYAALRLTGLIEEVVIDVPDRPPHLRRRWALSNLASMASNPVQYVIETLGWRSVDGISQFGAEASWDFLAYLTRILDQAGIATQSVAVADALVGTNRPFEQDSPLLVSIPQLDVLVVQDVVPSVGWAEAGVSIVPVPPAGEPGAEDIGGLYIGNYGKAGLDVVLPLSSTWEAQLSSELDATGQVGVYLYPETTPMFDVATGLAGTASFGLTYLSPHATEPPAEAVLSLGLRAFRMGVDLRYGHSTANALVMSAQAEDVTVALDLANAGSFFSELFGQTHLNAAFDLEARWSTATGFSFGGSSSFEANIDFPVGQSLGDVLRIDTVHLDVGVSQDNHLAVDFSVSAEASLGPFRALITRIGAGALVSFPDDGGNLGPLQLDGPTFKKPSSIGLSIETTGLSGGGALYAAPDANEFGGVLELHFGKFDLAAFGIINTDPPWSALFSLYASRLNIPVGLGLTLQGVGGLAAINRCMDPEALSSAVRAGSLDSLLFPEDPIGDAHRILSDLQGFFPEAPGTFVFGPFVQLGWGGTAEFPLGFIELGILLQLPDPLIITALGSIDLGLPTREDRLVSLKLAVLGILNLDEKYFWLEASLHGSHIANFPLTGDMALRYHWGSRRQFLFSLGGFHPQFEAPDSFPVLERLALGISDGSAFNISFSCYLAFTTNSLQFGADLDLWAGVDAFYVEGGMSFDALVYFKPFSLTFELSLFASVSSGSIDLFGVNVYGMVTGPGPWKVIADAVVTILAIDIPLHIEAQFGDVVDDPQLSTNLQGDLFRLVNDPANLELVDPASTGVVLRSPAVGEAREFTVDPKGSIRFNQVLVPLRTEIEHYRYDRDIQHNKFVIRAPEAWENVERLFDHFVPSEFFLIPQREQLSRPSFEEMPSGIEFQGPSSMGANRIASNHFEEYYRDPDNGEPWVRTDEMPPADQDYALDQNNDFAVAGVTGVTMQHETFSVIDTTTGIVEAANLTWSDAHVTAGPLGAHVTVVPTWELQ